MKKHLPLILLFSLAFLIRLAFVPNPGFEADVAFWKGWGLASADKGAVWSMLNTNNNYPTPFSYTLGSMVSIYRLLGGDPHQVTNFWSNTNTRFLLASKIFPILADLGIAFLFIWFGRKPQKFGFPVEQITPGKSRKFSNLFDMSSQNLFTILAGLYLLNPVSIMDGAWWGQVDSLGVVIFLLCFVAIAKKQLFLAGCIFMLAMMTKLQNMIYGPILFTFLWQQFGFRQSLQAFAGAVVAFFGLNIEFFLTANKARVLASLTDNYDYFPYMSLNSYNIWWIIAKGDGMGVSDKLIMLGRSTAKNLGLFFFIGSYLLAVLKISLPSLISIFTGKTSNKPEESPTTLQLKNVEKFFLGMSIINAGFFLLLTQSHERYAFPMFVFMLLLVPFLKGIRRTIFIIMYVFFSILYFYNLHTAFSVNYPDNGFQLLQGWLLTATPTMFVSWIFMIGFGLFLYFFRKTITPLPFIISGAVVFFLIVSQNISYLRKQPQALSSFTPWYSTQQFSRRVDDMPVNGGYGPKTWTWLSTQYVFYRKGVGTHANSELRYDIAGRFKEFTTDFGIDTTAGTGASAIFEIWADGKQLFVSDKMGRFDMPKHARVDIRGVKTLTLITRDADDSNRDDHTNWLNPKLYP